jgi:hypothetical protein
MLENFDGPVNMQKKNLKILKDQSQLSPRQSMLIDTIFKQFLSGETVPLKYFLPALEIASCVTNH